MEESQDLSTVSTVAKRRGRKPKNVQSVEQESTLPDFSEKSETKTEEESKVKNKSKQEVPRSTVSWIDKKPEEVPKQRSTSASDWGYARGSEGMTSHPTPETAYEWLGLRTVEPTMRPPILELSQSNEMRVAWASKDCTLAGSMLRRARPIRTLEASFFDRLELIRRIAVSEVAKAENAMEAVSVLGIVFDREALILGAEEVYGMSKGRELVLDTAPGNYDELSARIAADRRLRRNTRRRDMPGRADGKNVKPLSKGSTPYVSPKPFLERGTEVLHMPWCPRATSTLTSERGPRRSSDWIDEPALAGMESPRGSKTPIPMASRRCTHSLEWPRSSSAGGRLYEETERRDKERNETIGTGWSVQFYERERRPNSASIFDPQEIRGQAPHSRSAWDQLPHSCSSLHLTRGKRCVSCCSRQQLAMLPRFAQGISTGLYGPRGPQVSWCTDRREDSDIERSSLRLVTQSVCFHQVNQLGCRCDQEEDRTKNCSIHRRLFGWVGDGTATARWSEGNPRTFQQAGHNTFGQETGCSGKTGRTPWISLVSRAQDNWNYGGTLQRVSAEDQEPFENASACREMEECCGKINLCKRGCRANPQTCQEYLKTLEGQEGWNTNYPHTGSHRGSNLVVKHLEREERAKSLTERSESIYYHRCIRCGRKLCLGEWQHSNREEPKCGEHRCKHQCKRTRSAPEVLGDILEGMRVLWYTDSITARAAVMRQGTQNLSLDTWKVAKTILDIMERRQIKITAKHVPGALNRLADALSRPGQAEDKWEEALRRIVSIWGPMEFDPYGFAKASTGPVEDMKWSERRTLLKPPVAKIPELLELIKLKLDLEPRKNPPSFWESCAILVTPTWKQSLWWNQLVEMRRDWLDLGQIPEKTFRGWETRNSHPPSWTASLIAMKEPCGHPVLERNTSEYCVSL